MLLSDATDAEVALMAPVSGPARVVHSPQGAHLEPGEILVAPSTDPGWTPLFLTASINLGLPLLLMPMFGDQPANAEMAEAAGEWHSSFSRRRLRLRRYETPPMRC